MISDTLAAGFLINYKKSALEPCTRLRHLGFELDMTVNRFFLPADRAERISSSVALLLRDNGGAVKRISSVTGQIMSSATATGKLAYTYTRGLYCLIEQRPSWNAWLSLSPAARRELEFWSAVSFTTLSSPIFIPASRTDLVVHTDAGKDLWGAIIKAANIRVQGTFSLLGPLPESLHPEHSSTLRELFAIWAALQPSALLSFASGREVVVFTDSANTDRIITKGGTMTPDLHSWALRLFSHCVEHNVRLRSSWLRRSENTEADAITHDPDLAMWHVTPAAFALITEALGSPTSDLFASAANTKHERFASRYYDPAASWTDAFTMSWSASHDPLVGLRPWICPPIPLLGRCIRKLRDDQASAILIVPIWQRQPWWPLIAPDGCHWSPAVRKVVYLPAEPSPFAPDPEAMFPPPPASRTAAVFLSYESRFPPITALRCIWGRKCRRCHPEVLSP